MRRALPAALIGAGLLLICAVGFVWWGKWRESRVRGIITAVEARDIGHASAIMVRTGDGKQTRFLVDASVDVEWTPGHLRDHMTFAQPVTVYYRRAGEGLVAYRVTD
ncbi:MAG TPA: hypothetical protein VFX49_12375 [Chloroflexota bacterium]|nr:hypothetical protein [Chloroflexota bacterium]